MPAPRDGPDDRPNVGSQPLETEIQALQGEELPADQDGALSLDEVESRPEPTRTDRDSGAESDVDASVLVDPNAEIVSLDALVDGELRAGETTDPITAIEEGQAWIPPSDPPTAPSDDPQGIEIAAGAGMSAEDEPYDDDHRSGEDGVESEMNARIRDALRADAATTAYADQLEIAVLGSTAVLRGVVDDIDDGDTLADVAGRVTGIDEVRDETVVAGLER